MKRIILVVIFLSTNSLFSRAQTTQPDMTVFGYKLGEKISIPECPCKIVESKVVGNYGLLSIKHFKGYQYLAVAGIPVSSTCFERLDLDKYNVRTSDLLNPLPEISNGMINVLFAPKDAPAADMCPLGSFNAVVEDSKLTGVTFLIYTGDANNIFETLKKKYGIGAIVNSYKVQNGYGASLDYYTAVWAFPHLGVLLQSSLHRSLSEQFGSIAIEIPKKSDPPPANQRKL